MVHLVSRANGCFWVVTVVLGSLLMIAYRAARLQVVTLPMSSMSSKLRHGTTFVAMRASNKATIRKCTSTVERHAQADEKTVAEP